MTWLKRRDVEAALKKKGFTVEERDHRYYRLLVDGEPTGIYTKVSTGKKYRDLGRDLVTLMAKQLKLTRKEFADLVSCEITADRYLALLRERDEIL